MRPSFFNTDFVCVTERERVYVSICVVAEGQWGDGVRVIET